MKYSTGGYTISPQEYFDADGVSRSDLVKVLRSPAHFKHGPKRVETDAMKIGTAAHTLILQPGAFSELYAIGPVEDRRLKAWAEAESAAAGKTLLKPSVVRGLEGMRNAVRAHAEASRCLALGYGAPELSLFWEWLTGTMLKARPDWITTGGWIIDLKTTDDARLGNWERHAVDLGYDMQAAMQVDGYGEVYGEKPAGFKWVVVEKDPPYAVVVLEPDADFIDYGRRRYRQAAAAYHRCVEADVWPAYPEGVQVVGLPRFAQAELEAAISRGDF